MGRNWQYACIKGREMRLEAELKAHQTGDRSHLQIPLFSHDATIQSHFVKGWRYVATADICHHVYVNSVPIEEQQRHEKRIKRTDHK